MWLYLNLIQKLCPYILLILIACHSPSEDLSSSEDLQTDVLVVGGGASGVTAAIQAAREGQQVILVEHTPWLGGMLTTAGVSATDGNHKLPSGLWGEFRQKLYNYYGGAEAVATGWVSNTQFEPHVGDSIFKQMADSESNLRRIHGYYIISAIKEGNQVKGGVFVNDNQDTLKVQATISIDATEYGDLMSLSGANYFVGEDPKSRTGEALAPEQASDVIQDLTYVAILKDYGVGADKTIPKPEGYDPAEFLCICKELCPDNSMPEFSCDQMLTYGKLPHDKYMINWPRNGNDYYLNALEMNHEERKLAWEKAKQHTLKFVYFLQTEGGYKSLGLAEDEFPASDLMPLIPYHRESRRLDGVEMITVMDLFNPYREDGQALYKQAIAVGDYPLDHHKAEGPRPEEIDFPRIPSFSIPYGSLVPKEIDGLLVAEKSISVSHLANGSTRLQPCVMLIGQAAGMAAALCAEQQVNSRNLEVRKLQQKLLDADCWLLPFIDIQPDDWYFEALQKMGVSGLMRGEGKSVGWANQTLIHPDSAMTVSEVQQVLKTMLRNNKLFPASEKNKIASRREVCLLIWKTLTIPDGEQKKLTFQDVEKDSELYKCLSVFKEKGWLAHWTEENMFEPEKPMTRKELAFIIQKAFDPFLQIS